MLSGPSDKELAYGLVRTRVSTDETHNTDRRVKSEPPQNALGPKQEKRGIRGQVLPWLGGHLLFKYSPSGLGSLEVNNLST